MPKTLTRKTPIPEHQPFAQRLVDWHRLHGRHDLPWQNCTDPYRVWLSEIMLQQTQVKTVQAYYQRFLEHFPTLADLARATPEQVLAHWSGLGYYSRARNLHQCARQVMAQWGGQFPIRSQELQQLSGIGASTAAAIAAICHQEQCAIFDGNVQRVLSRHTGSPKIWQKVALSAHYWKSRNCAFRLLPRCPNIPRPSWIWVLRLCTSRRPQCQHCPVAADCQALAQNRVGELPHKTRNHKRQQQNWWLLKVQHPKRGVWLQQRPSTGIWPQLYCFPCYPSQAHMLRQLPVAVRSQITEATPLRHQLTHLDLCLHLCSIVWVPDDSWPEPGAWFKPSTWANLGLPKPMRDWLHLGSR